MSSVILSGDTSGAVTLAVPAVAGTNTLTLPAVTGTILTNVSTGTILQVIQTNYTGTASSTSGTPADVSGFSASITPRSATNKILVTVCTSFGFDSDSGGDPYPYILLLRNGTSIGTGVNATGNQINVFLSGPALPGNLDVKSKYKHLPATRMFLDSPATVSALTYKIQLAQPFSGAPGYLNRQANTDNNTYIQSVASSITLMEVAA